MTGRAEEEVEEVCGGTKGSWPGALSLSVSAGHDRRSMPLATREQNE